MDPISVASARQFLTAWDNTSNSSSKEEREGVIKDFKLAIGTQDIKSGKEILQLLKTEFSGDKVLVAKTEKLIRFLNWTSPGTGSEGRRLAGRSIPKSLVEAEVQAVAVRLPDVYTPAKIFGGAVGGPATPYDSPSVMLNRAVGGPALPKADDSRPSGGEPAAVARGEGLGKVEGLEPTSKPLEKLISFFKEWKKDEFNPDWTTKKLIATGYEAAETNSLQVLSSLVNQINVKAKATGDADLSGIAREFARRASIHLL